MKYSEAELAEAAKNANGEGVYFRGLDWNNMEGKWGHVVSPWRDLYPYCWDHLREVCIFVRDFKAEYVKTLSIRLHDGVCPSYRLLS